ncbi:hypothetical protein V6Z11_A10G148200 [Gossypium hirsutum]
MQSIFFLKFIFAFHSSASSATEKGSLKPRPRGSGGVRCACCYGGVREALREVANGEERRLKRELGFAC